MGPYDGPLTADSLNMSVVEASSLLATCVSQCMVCSGSLSSVTRQVVCGMWMVAHTATLQLYIEQGKILLEILFMSHLLFLPITIICHLLVDNVINSHHLV